MEEVELRIGCGKDGEDTDKSSIEGLSIIIHFFEYFTSKTSQI
jgi:hypothetical protein